MDRLFDSWMTKWFGYRIAGLLLSI